MGYANKVRSTAAETVETPELVEAPASVAPREWSKQQEAIFSWFEGAQGNLIVRARAGTGKTTTILEGINRAPEDSILCAAFNKRIADELTKRITNPNAEAKTLHAIGFAIIKQYWSRVRVSESYSRGSKLCRADALTERVCGSSTPDTIKRLVTKLHTKGREITPHATEGIQLDALAEQFECAPEDFWSHQGYDVQWVCDKAAEVMRLAVSQHEPPSEGIDFADMIFLPIVKGWAMPKYMLGVVDEAQDMTPSQLELFQKVCKGRICVVGDDLQAIYAFRGADSNSLDRLKGELDAEELGLTVTYRCGKNIVKLAQSYAPDFTAGDHNSEGEITTTSHEKLVGELEPGVFVLSRLNAPLAGIAMSLLRANKRVRIAGRDIGQGLKTLVRQIAKGARSVPEFCGALDSWEHKQYTRAARLHWKTKADTVRDQAQTLRYLAMDATGVNDIERRIDTLFTDDGLGDKGVVTCSSVHKAKGLEADTVYVLKGTLKEKNQEEKNIAYVAVTRARHKLVWVE